MFAAARSEFKHLEHFYFHNCLYEGVWKTNTRRHAERTPTWDLLHTFPHDYKLIFVGDAAMSPYEIVMEGGSVEHMNEEPGKAWLERALTCWPHAVWLNPTPETHWPYTQSIGDGAANHGKPHVSADAGRAGGGDARVDAVIYRKGSHSRGSKRKLLIA